MIGFHRIAPNFDAPDAFMRAVAARVILLRTCRRSGERRTAGSVRTPDGNAWRHPIVGWIMREDGLPTRDNHRHIRRYGPATPWPIAAQIAAHGRLCGTGWPEPSEPPWIHSTASGSARACRNDRNERGQQPLQPDRIGSDQRNRRPAAKTARIHLPIYRPMTRQRPLQRYSRQRSATGAAGSAADAWLAPTCEHRVKIRGILFQTCVGSCREPLISTSGRIRRSNFAVPATPPRTRGATAARDRRPSPHTNVAPTNRTTIAIA